jgi:hypothetical protein
VSAILAETRYVHEFRNLQRKKTRPVNGRATCSEFSVKLASSRFKPLQAAAAINPEGACVPADTVSTS